MVRTAVQKIADVLIFLCGFLIFCDILLPLACVPPRQDSSPDNSSFRKEVDA